MSGRSVPFVKKYSDFIEHPIVMDVEKEQDSTIAKGEKVKVKGGGDPQLPEGHMAEEQL